MTYKEFMLSIFPNAEKYRDEVMVKNKEFTDQIYEILSQNKNVSNKQIDKLKKIRKQYENNSNKLDYYTILYVSKYNDNSISYNKELIETSIEYFKELEEYENCEYIKKHFNI